MEPSSPASNPNRRRWSRNEEMVTIEPISARPDEPSVQMPLSVIADLQDSLLVVMNDLKRLEGLLDHATANLLDRFNTASLAAENLGDDVAGVESVRQALHLAVTELQFHDMSSQLLVHTGKVLRGCAYKLAEQAMEPDEDESAVVVSHLPERPNPVTQSEMDAGSVELF